MDNLTIIRTAKENLYNEGLIKSMDEDLLTKTSWRKKGYKIKKEAYPITCQSLWVYIPGKKLDGDVNRKGIIYSRPSDLYTSEQVEKIKKAS